MSFILSTDINNNYLQTFNDINNLKKYLDLTKIPANLYCYVSYINLFGKLSFVKPTYPNYTKNVLPLIFKLCIQKDINNDYKFYIDKMLEYDYLKMYYDLLNNDNKCDVVTLYYDDDKNIIHASWIDDTLRYTDKYFELILNNKLIFRNKELRESFINKLLYVLDNLCKKHNLLKDKDISNKYINIKMFLNNNSNDYYPTYALFEFGLITKDIFDEKVKTYNLYEIGAYLIKHPNSSFNDIQKNCSLGFKQTKLLLDELNRFNILIHDKNYSLNVDTDTLNKIIFNK